VEQGAGVVITSRTETIDHAVAFDRIVSKSEGFVASFTEGAVSQDSVTGVWSFPITAQVALGKIKDAWGNTQLLLQQRGRPTVMVLVREVVQMRGGQTSDTTSNHAAHAIEKHLQDQGFQIKASAGLQERELRERDAAVAVGDTGKLAQIARTYGADLVIGGDLVCRFDRAVNLPGGMQGFRYVSAAQLQAYRTDTGDVVAPVAVDGYGTAHGEGEAQIKAMEMAGRKLSREVLKDILNQWYFEFQHGGMFEFEITITADDPKDLRKAERYVRKVKALLSGLKGVDEVIQKAYDNPPGGTSALLRLAVKSKMNAEQIQGLISDEDTEGWSLVLAGSKGALVKYTLYIE
jgi:hypothetical protein